MKRMILISHRNILLAAVLLLCAVMAAGSSTIGRTGSCTAATTACTFSATATGDLKLLFAYRSGSTTPPTAPAGWTSITTGTIGSSGTLGSFRIGCNQSSSSADTGSGTWTNASTVAGISYSGTLVTSTSNCHLTGVGGKASTGAQTSATASYNTITMTHTDGTSWVTGFLATSAGGDCTPSGMTNSSNAGAGPSTRVSDTNVGVTAWATTTCSVTSGTWMTEDIEILGSNGPFLHVQGKSGTTTTVSSSSLVLSAAPKSGDIVVVGLLNVNTITGLTVTDANSNSYTLSPKSPLTLTGSAAQVWVAYLLSAPSNASATINFSWTGSQSVTMFGDEFSVLGGNQLFDNDATGLGASGTTINTPVVTPTRTNQLIWVVAQTAGTISAPSPGSSLSGWTGSGGAIANGNMAEYQLSASAAVTTAFTQSTAAWGAVGIAFELPPPRLPLVGVGD